MGLMKLIFGGGVKAAGDAVTGIVETFRPNSEAAAKRQYEGEIARLDQMAAEFKNSGGWFNRFVDGLNRLPRPVMALGTIGLFAYAMTDPLGFTERMVGLQAVPEPLWWLLGAIVSFYFGARELKYARDNAKTKEFVATATTIASAQSEIAELRETYLTPGSANTDDPEIIEEALG